MKIAVHLHLYYLEQTDYFIGKLRNIGTTPFDLFVTMVVDNAAIQQKIRAFKPDSQIWIVENRGYDVGPFIDFINRINLDKYDYILKLHTKGGASSWATNMKLNGFCLNNTDWRHLLMQAVLKNRAQVIRNLKRFEKDATISLIGSSACRSDKFSLYKKLLPQINGIIERCGLAPIANCEFIAGTIFWARAKIFKPLQGRFCLTDFEPTDGHVKEGALAHAMERVFGILATQKDGRIEGVKAPFLFFVKHSINWLLRLIYQNKKSGGKHIIKILRIPVYHKKEVSCK